MLIGTLRTMVNKLYEESVNTTFIGNINSWPKN